MIVARTRDELIEALRELRGRGETLALVPTMGALHEGHLRLVGEGAALAKRVAVSIFVNPTQFGEGEDLDRYPRTLERDLEACRREGVWLVYAPADPGEVYRDGYATWVDLEGSLVSGLCGASRPGHFRGVATVVCKLLGLFRPDYAVFGEKDFQQLAVIRRMARDLDLDAWTEIVGVPTVREADGLALSSRNAYLSAEERQRALSLRRGLDEAQAAFASGEREARKILQRVLGELEGQVDRVDYVEVVDAASLEPVERIEGEACVLIAAFVGATRLIDNQVLGREE